MGILDLVRKYKAKEKKVITGIDQGNVEPSPKGLPATKQAPRKVSIGKDIKEAEALSAEARKKGWVK
ncbi:hypothetical protein KKE60_05980 [Patescibacteria group bacterium]|nr:hypothetical protein [Patescibacteria group bacterium]